MKKYIYMAVAAMAALSSCKDDSNEIADTPPIIDNETPTVFTATMEGAPETRATYDAGLKCASWEVGDQVNIDGSIYDAQSSGTTTTFKSTNPSSNEIRPEFIHSDISGWNGEEARMLVDDAGVDTKWCSNKKEHIPPAYNGIWEIIVSTGSAIKLQAIKLWNGNDTQQNPGRRWKNVRISGDSYLWGSYETIKTFENLNLASDNKGLAGILEVNATKEYYYYKIEILDVESGDDMQMSDMKFVLPQQSVEVNNHKAYFPATLYNGVTATLPSVITETWAAGKFNMPMYASSTNNNLTFKNLCGVLKITVKSDQLASVKSITVSSANKATSGAFTVDNNNAAQLTRPNDAGRTVTVNYTKAVPTTASGTEFYIAIPAQTYQDLLIEVSDGAAIKDMKTKSGANIVVERNKIYPITFVGGNMSDANLLPGLFSVSPTKKVRFTKGNLYWDGSAFKFENRQIDFDHGTLSENDHYVYTPSHVSHFFWTKRQDYESGNSDYMPYAYFFSQSSPESSTDLLWCAEENKISVEGTQGLYVLSGGPGGEWDYLIARRENAASLCKLPVTVMGQENCFVFAPDDYRGTIAASYTAAEWTAAENKGLVCLPPTSYRLTYCINSNTSDFNFYSAANAGFASEVSAPGYLLKFTNNHHEKVPVCSQHRGTAAAIRLVK